MKKTADRRPPGRRDRRGMDPRGAKPRVGGPPDGRRAQPVRPASTPPRPAPAPPAAGTPQPAPQRAGHPARGGAIADGPASAARYVYRETGRYFAQVSEGLEGLTQAELTALGATDLVPGVRGVAFGADHRSLYRVAYCSRLIQKIIAPLRSFDCHSAKDLYRQAKPFPWTDFLTPTRTFVISANVSTSHISHSQYAALCLKDAIADHFRECCGERPSVERDDPDLRFHLYIHDNRATIGLEVSGGSLHKRGYRQIGHEAPIQETVAAGIIRLAEWEGQQPLVDPMCGSGTLLCEALMHYCRIPAGYLRSRFGLESLPDFDAAAWASVRAAARAEMRPLPEGLIRGSDISKEAVSAARANLDQLPFGKGVALATLDFRHIPRLTKTTIVSNPPHGIRLQQAEGMETFCRELGDFLKQRCQDSQAYLYFGNRELIKQIGLRTTWKKPLSSGGVEGRLIKLVLY